MTEPADDSQQYERDSIYTNATISLDGERPLVFWHLNGKEGTMTLAETRIRAEGLLTAAAMAETEARIAIGISGVEEAGKGFGMTAEKRKADLNFQKLRNAMKILRAPLPDGIEVIFGQTSRLPLVNIHWYGEPVQLTTAAIRNHAYDLIQAAEASESDRFFYKFLNEIADLTQEQVASLIKEFSEYRNRQRLRDLMELDSDRPLA